MLLGEKNKLISCSGFYDKKIKVWNLDTFKCIQVFKGHTEKVLCLDVTSKGNLLSCSSDKTIKLWQIETGQLLKSISFDFEVTSIKVLTDELIVASFGNGEIQIYNLNKMEPYKTIQAHTSEVHRLNLLPNGDLLSGSVKGDIKLWRMLENY